MPESDVTNIRSSSRIRKASRHVAIYQFVPCLAVAGVRSGGGPIKQTLSSGAQILVSSTILQQKETAPPEEMADSRKGAGNRQEELSDLKVSCLVTVAPMRGLGVTVTWLASPARDEVPVSISAMVTGPPCDVGQTGACARVWVTNASSPTRGTLRGIHARRMTGAS